MSGPVLFVDLSGRIGGAERSLRELISAFVREYDGEVVLASAVAAGSVSPCRVISVPPVRLHRPSSGRAFFRSLAELWAARLALRTAIRELRPDFVVANGIAAALALPGCGAKVIWYVRDMPRRPYARIAALRSDCIVAISQAVAMRCRECLPIRLYGRIRIVENGVDLSRFKSVAAKREARAALGIPVECFVVGMVANLVPWKRHDAFVEMAAVAMRRLGNVESRNVRWVVAGDDLYGEHADYIARLRRTIAELGLEDSFMMVFGKDSTELMPAFDVLVHPALEEPFGRVICEAMASGVPVVAAGSGGPAEILVDGESGVLVAPSSAENFAEAVLRLMGNETERSGLVARARLDVAERFAHQRVAKDFLACLR